MSFDWSEYLKLARQLAGKAKLSVTRESRLRSAISRAYYAAFIQARNYLRDRESVTIPRQNSHQYVINYFRSSSQSDRQTIGKNLARLRQNRNKADYNDIIPKVEKTSQLSLKLADRIIKQLQGL